MTPRAESEIYRRRAAMVVYSIEVAFVELMRERKIPFDPDRITFGEIFQELGKLGVNDSEAMVCKELKSLADALELASIRNACAHPVREFHLYQWYRVASFAADPRLQLLKLTDIGEALACAESGQISDPPSEWLERIRIPALPNNLPQQEKFDATGLIGRSKEVDMLLADLVSGRLNTIALVGPGGVGKTSVAVEVARRIASTIGAARKFDGVVYLSFKTRELTAKGVLQIDAASISKDIDAQFNEALQRVLQIGGIPSRELLELATGDDLLVVLDNFEDLLLERPAACEMFLNTLPANWKVLITSRVSVDGAKNVAVKGLSSSAIEGLARKYYETVAGACIPADVLNKVKTACNGNPLALKLMIDRVGLGETVDEAKAVTQGEILSYSFTSLIQSLSEQQKTVLEAVFVLGAAFRVNLLELTGYSSEELVESLNLLARTSLIERISSETDEHLVIASAVRELLARSPLNLETRTNFSKKLATIRAQTASAPTTDLIDTFTFDPRTPGALKTLGAKLPRLWAHQNVALSTRDEQYVRNFEEKIPAYESACRGVEDYYRLRAYSRSLLRDAEMALTFSRQAWEIAPTSIVTCQLYASLLIHDRKNAEAREVLSPIISELMKRIAKGEDLLQVYGPTVIRETFSSFFKTFIWDNEYEDVLRLTEQWGRVPEFLRVPFAVSRAASLRRKFEREQKADVHRCKALLEAARIIVYCHRDLNVPVVALNREAGKLRKELCYQLSAVSLEFREELVKSANRITEALDDSFPIVQLPILAGEFPRSDAGTTPERALPAGAIAATIYNLKPTYCFAQSEDGSQYFIPFATFEYGRTPSRLGEKAFVWELAAAPGATGATRAGAARLV